MKIAYLILAHNNPLHLQRLITAIKSPSSEIFLHIDKNSKIEQFSNLDFGSINLCNQRFRVFRSHFSQVQAILALMNQALEHASNFDRFVLLSGTDYPLRSAAYIQDYFEHHQTDECINLVKMPNLSEGKPLSRLTGFKPSPTQPRYLMERLFRGSLRRLGLIPKERDYNKALNGMTPYGGAEWWALTRKACSYIVEFVNREKEYVKFFHHSQNPEEMFFHIIVGNSLFRENITNYLTFTDWSAGGGHPAQIGMHHLDKFRDKMFGKNQNPCSGEFLFTRKFSDGSGLVVDYIDDLICQSFT